MLNIAGPIIYLYDNLRALFFPFIFQAFLLWISQKTDAFELWGWSRLLRVPWISRRSYRSVLKEIQELVAAPEYSLEGLMLTLKLQYFGHLMQRADSFENILMLGDIKGGKRRG